MTKTRGCRAVLLSAALAFLACQSDSSSEGGLGARSDASRTSRGSFSFAVLGDAPYSRIEERKFERVIGQLNEEELAWVIHVGDILWYPCSDELFASRLESLQTIRHPVLYTPGDNEWTDCHEPRAGRYGPLERLTALRGTFFADPFLSLGGTAIALESQSAEGAWAEFVENARWERGGIVFATVHLVGSWNGYGTFDGRTDASDAEAARRTEAATAWLRDSFAAAAGTGARAVVVAFHADPGFGSPPDHPYRQSYEPFLEALEEEVERFERPVLLLHGDSHQQRVDRPLTRRTTGLPLENLTRLEIFGSPDVGWVRVVVDTIGPELFRFEPEKIPAWKVW